ncbi:hypothetical protein PIROE2DRAFT_17322, partial [Piromyces sp. E2]
SEFYNSEEYSKIKLDSGGFIFLKFWYIPDYHLYTITPLPGGKDGISGSCIGGYNIGINSYITDEKKEASIKVLEYINSKEIQKKVIKEYHLYSAIPSLYDDEDVCATVNCTFIKNMQFTLRPKEKNYNYYSKQFRTYIYEFLYGGGGGDGGSVTFIIPYDVETKLIEGGKNFQICRMEHTSGTIIIWSMEETYNDIRFLVLAIYMDIFFFILFIIVNNLKIDHYLLSFTLYNILYILISVINYLFIYGYRIIYETIKINNEEEELIKQLKENFKDNDEDVERITTSTSKSYNNTSNQDIFTNKLLNYHYRVSITSKNSYSSQNVIEKNLEKNNC